MRADLFDYELPEELIAKEPAHPRDHSRLLVVERTGDAVFHQRFFQLKDWLRPGDLLVVNESKVIPARLYARGASGQRFEFLILSTPKTGPWPCLARPGKKIREKTPVTLGDGTTCYVYRATSGFFFEPPFRGQREALAWLDQVGEPPLPPYLKRAPVAADRQCYQTIFAAEPGSVAAPTAGLHFTQALLKELEEQEVKSARITLHVGYGTFAPIQTEQLEDHQMHEEVYHIPPETLRALEQTKAKGGRIIAVGTTSLRALESLPVHGPQGCTRLFIRPGFQFQWADGLVTNFHLPRSSLLVLVGAFLGLERTHDCYKEAIQHGYRFYSYGDAMAILP